MLRKYYCILTILTSLSSNYIITVHKYSVLNACLFDDIKSNTILVHSAK